MNIKPMVKFSAAATLCLLLCGGCANTPKSNFYVLNPQVRNVPELKNSAKAKEATIVFNHIQSPKYLDWPLVVTRDSSYKLKVSEFNRWAEPLRDSFRNTVARNLSIILQNPKIGYTRQMNARLVDFYIDINIITMDGVLGESARLTVQWNVYRNSNHPDIAGTRISTYAAEVNGSSYEDYVIAQSQLAADFTLDLAKRLVEIANEPHQLTEPATTIK